MNNSTSNHMRHLMDLIQLNPDPQTNQVKEAFPVLKQASRAKWAGWLGKFSSRLRGEAEVKNAVTSYLTMFSRQLGVLGKTWSTVTWKDALNFIASGASLKLPLSDITPQRLTPQEIQQVLANHTYRTQVASFMGKHASELPTLMPPKIGSVWNQPVGGATADAADIAQRIMTGVFTVMVRAQILKAQDGAGFARPGTKSKKPKPLAPAPSAAPAPASAPAPTPRSTAQLQQIAQVLQTLTPAEKAYLKSLLP